MNRFAQQAASFRISTRLFATVLATGAAALLNPAAHAQAGKNTTLPTGGTIAAGQGSITRANTQLSVSQSTDRLVVNWNSFDIGTDATVRFEMPNAKSIALNRVTGGNPSSILGRLDANGSVWLLNPSGIVFGQGAQVNVAGLVASSLALSDADFLSGTSYFNSGAGAGPVVNFGQINAPGGVVALIAPQVRNAGSIHTAGGSTALVAGDRVGLDFNGDGLINVNVERPVFDALVENSGRISADGGAVVLTARGANAALASVVNNTGVIEARGLVSRGGRILLDGDAETDAVHVAGTLDVSSKTGNGGEITVTGHDLSLDGGAVLDASGRNGGGAIKVGGGWQGGDASVANATRLSVDNSVAVRANALESGNGGTAVFWSDDTTRFAGQIDLRGGAVSGNGGRAEVSGKHLLEYSGRTRALAPHGLTGDLILDPTTVTVQGGGTGGGAVSGSTVYEKDLEAQLANVLIQATGNINFSDLSLNGGDGVISMASDVSLRIEAGTTSTNSVPGSIVFANPANTLEVFGTGSLMLDAGSNGGSGGGNITNAPNLIAHGAGTNPGVLPSYTLTQVGTGTPTPGSITLYGADGVTIGGAVTTNGGYVRIWADSDDAGGGGFTLGTTSPIVTNGGNLYVSSGNDAIFLNANMTLGTGRLFFKADGTKSSGAKTLGGIIDSSGDVTVTTAFTMNAGAGIRTDGIIKLASTVDLNTGTGALTLRASSLDFSTATFNNLSTASMILEPADPTTSMVLGDITGFASATTLSKLPGIKNLAVGRRDATGTISLPASNFSFNASGTMEFINKTIDVSGGTLTNTTGNIVLTGDNVNIARTVTANGGNGSVTIRQMTAGTPIVLGSGLTNSAVGNISAATLVIGRSDGGNLTFDSDITTTASSVHLLSANRVIGDSGGVSAANLGVSAGGGASLTSSTFDFGTLALDVGGTTTVAKAAGGYALGTVDDISGLSIRTGTDAAVTLSAPGSITSGTAPIALNSNASTVTFRATDVTLAGSTVTGNGNASFALEPTVSSASLSVGGGSGFVTTASLSALTGSRNVTVGRSDGTGTTTVAGDISLGASGTLSLLNGDLALGTGSVTNTTGNLTLSASQGTIALDRNASAGGLLTLSAPNALSVTGTGNLTASGLVLDGHSAAFALTAGTHSVGTLAGTVGSLSFNQSGGLNVGALSGFNGITATGAVWLRTTGATSDLTLNQGIGSGASGNAIVLAAGRNFINNVGSSALSAASGNWLVFSTSPLSDTRGNLLYDYKQYATSYGGALLGTGNGVIYSVAPKVGFSLIGSTSKVYDSGTAASLVAGNYSGTGTIDGDSVAFSATGAAYDTKNVGTGKTVTASGLSLTSASNGTASVYGYQLLGTTASGSIGEITPATLSPLSASVANKVYDGGTGATVTGISMSGLLGSDVVGATASGAFADKNVADAKAVSVTGISLNGTDAGNYSLASTTTSGAANITPATISAAGATVSDKVYDGSTAASVSTVTLTGVLGSDTVAASGTGAFADKNAGSGKTVTVSGLGLSGADSGNYVLSSGTTTGSASVSQATLTTGTATVSDKVYDGTTTATVTGVAVTGVLGSDDIGTSATGEFADKNVGAGKTVSVSGVTLTGTDAGNYLLSSSTSSGTASITRAQLSVASSSVANKVYDGDTTATLNSVSLNGVFGSDVVATTGTGVFADKNVGSGKTVSLGGLSLTGTDAGNYTLDVSSATGLGNITPATLTVGSGSIANRVYDGTTVATVTGVSLGGVIGSDVVGTSATGAFADKNVGNGKAAAISGIALNGADAGNYILSATTSSGSANITPATLGLGSATIATKVYDGSTLANVSNVALTGVIGSDGVTALGNGAYSDRNVGNGKNVAVTGVSLSGADAANYILSTSSTSGLGNITPATLTVGSGSIANRVYDGTTVATVTGVSLGGVIGSDVVGTSATGAFADKNVGNGKAATISGIALNGADAGNYILSATTSSGSANITPATLAVGAADVATRVYDGTTVAGINSISLGGIIGGDAVSTHGSGSFADKNVGSGKVVTVSGLTLSGADAGNYVLDQATAHGAGSITPATLTTGSASVAGKVYDGTTLATVTFVSLSGVVSGDQIDTTGSGRFANKNVGSGKVVTVDGLVLHGADAGNYVLSSTDSLGAADITPATLGIGSVGIATKVYDGTTVAPVSVVSLSGTMSGDDIGATALGRFNDKNVGQGKAVSVSDVTLRGADALNYVLSTTQASGTGNITPALLSVGPAVVLDKTYDGTTKATVAGVTLSGVLGADKVNTSATGSFADKNAGLDKVVSVSGIALSGEDAGNYVLSTGATTGIADVNKAVIAVTGVQVQDKVSDGSSSVSVGGVTLSGVIEGDVLTASGVGRFVDPSAGRNKDVAVSELTLSGPDSGNYDLASTSFLTKGNLDAAPTSSAVTALTSPVATSNGTSPAQHFSGGVNLAGPASTTPAPLLSSGSSGTSGGSGAGSFRINGSVATSGAGNGDLSFGSAGSSAASGSSGASGASGASGSGSGATVAGASGAGTASGGGSSSGSASASGSNSGAGSASLAGGGSGAGTSVVFSSESMLSGNGTLSLALSGGEAAAPVSATLPVYSVQSGTSLVGEGQFIVTDRGNSLSLLPFGSDQKAPPSLAQQVTRSTRASIPTEAGVQVTLGVDLLADGTLSVSVPNEAGTLSNETLATYAIAVAKQSFGLPVDGISAVVLKSDAETDGRF